jgi:hypothetical protein
MSNARSSRSVCTVFPFDGPLTRAPRLVRRAATARGSDRGGIAHVARIGGRGAPRVEPSRGPSEVKGEGLWPPRSSRVGRACLSTRAGQHAKGMVPQHAPVAQLDRASGFEPAGRVFDSPRARYAGRAFLGHRNISKTLGCARTVPEGGRGYSGAGAIATMRVRTSLPRRCRALRQFHGLGHPGRRPRAASSRSIPTSFSLRRFHGGAPPRRHSSIRQ